MVMQPRVAISSVSTTEPKGFGERIKAARLAKGISQADLAALVGVSPGAIGNYEAAGRNSSRKSAAIATALGVRAQWLESGLGPMYETPQNAGQTLVAHGLCFMPTPHRHQLH